MSKSANKTLIGAFVVGALALLVLGIAVFGSGILFKKTTTFVMFFEKSISGLNVGSPVVFSGVPVGRVSAIRMVDGGKGSTVFRIPVYVELDNKDDGPLADSSYRSEEEAKDYLLLLLERGLRGRLSPQSLLTGQLMIELDFFPPYEAGPRVTEVKEYDDVWEIPTIPSRLDSIWHKFSTMPVDDIAANILKISQHINQMLERTEVRDLIAHTDELVQEIRKAAVNLEGTLAGIRSASERYAALAQTMDHRLIASAASFDETLKSFRVAAGEAERVLSSARSVVGQNSVTIQEFNRTLREIAEAARAVRGLAGTLQRNPESVLFGKGEPRR